ncbi:MAG: hypothetical protein AAGL97_14155 [Pseudomonadota bacterium]
MRKLTKTPSTNFVVFAYGLATVCVLFAFLSPLSLGALGTDRLIQYDGQIVSVKRSNGLGINPFSPNEVQVTIQYDGGEVETHSIKSSLNVKRLDQIGNALMAARGDRVIVSFLPDDRTLAEVKSRAGEIFLPQDQIRGSTVFTAISVGLFGLGLLILAVYSHHKLPRLKAR